MSSGVDVRRRPNIWSYFSFSGPRRRTSVSLPRSNAGPASADDPFEKPDRHARHRSNTNNGFMNDLKSGTMTGGQRARYLKTGGIIAFIILVLWYIAPRDSLARAGESLSSSGGNTASPGAEAKCAKSYSKDKPLIQYALMIDAGSTGSRIHVYKFNNCGPTPELESEVFKQTEKREGGSGLSIYPGDAEGAAKSLDILLDTAVENVPESYRSCTPIAVKATAGLRKLGDKMSDEILKAVRNRLETKYPFPVVSDAEGGVQVMPGEMEGVYAWITTNYLLGKIGGPDKRPTAAVLDLGGGSTQIVFEPTFPDVPKGGLPDKLEDGDHKYDLKFGGRTFTLYQHSYLGYGLMEARNNLHSSIIETNYQQHKDSENHDWLKKAIVNPCIGQGMSRAVNITMPENHPVGHKLTLVNMTGPAEGSPAICRGVTEKTLHKDAECKINPCAFRGVHQPSFEQTFAREDVYLLSYFYDRTEPLGMPESFTLSELKDLVNRVCLGEQAWDIFNGVQDAIKELRDRPEWCLDLNFQLALLHTGYGMPLDREVKIAKKIKGNELGWCLGASLPLLEKGSGWQCKIKEIH